MNAEVVTAATTADGFTWFFGGMILAGIIWFLTTGRPHKPRRRTTRPKGSSSLPQQPRDPFSGQWGGFDNLGSLNNPNNPYNPYEPDLTLREKTRLAMLEAWYRAHEWTNGDDNDK